jgi:hypothetical protein
MTGDGRKRRQVAAGGSQQQRDCENDGGSAHG